MAAVVKGFGRRPRNTRRRPSSPASETLHRSGNSRQIRDVTAIAAIDLAIYCIIHCDQNVVFEPTVVVTWI